jgi:hypothetical protein
VKRERHFFEKMPATLMRKQMGGKRNQAKTKIIHHRAHNVLGANQLTGSGGSASAVATSASESTTTADEEVMLGWECHDAPKAKFLI